MPAKENELLLWFYLFVFSVLENKGTHYFLITKFIFLV